MTSQTRLVDLVAGYDAYSTVEELNVRAVGDAPATTAICAKISMFSMRYSPQVSQIAERATGPIVPPTIRLFGNNR